MCQDKAFNIIYLATVHDVPMLRDSNRIEGLTIKNQILEIYPNISEFGLSSKDSCFSVKSIVLGDKRLY